MRRGSKLPKQTLFIYRLHISSKLKLSFLSFVLLIKLLFKNFMKYILIIFIPTYKQICPHSSNFNFFFLSQNVNVKKKYKVYMQLNEIFLSSSLNMARKKTPSELSDISQLILFICLLVGLFFQDVDSL